MHCQGGNRTTLGGLLARHPPLGPSAPRVRGEGRAVTVSRSGHSGTPTCWPGSGRRLAGSVRPLLMAGAAGPSVIATGQGSDHRCLARYMALAACSASDNADHPDCSRRTHPTADPQLAPARSATGGGWRSSCRRGNPPNRSIRRCWKWRGWSCARVAGHRRYYRIRPVPMIELDHWLTDLPAGSGAPVSSHRKATSTAGGRHE